MREILTMEAVPGTIVAIRVAGQPPYGAALGWRDPHAAASLALDDRFYVYSISKTLLAATTLRLASAGKLALDAPIADYLPEVTLPAPVTIRQLLGHTAGLPDYGGVPEYAAAVRATPETPWTAAEFLARTLPRGLLFPPGTGWAYSNIGFLLIRQLLERVTGEPLDILLHRALFAPLGLQQTAVAATLADAASLTPGWSTFLDPAGDLADVTPRYHPGWVSHGVVTATAPELAQLVEAIITGPLLSADDRATLLTPTILPFAHPQFRQPAYGLGVMLDPGSPHGLIAGHAGGGPGHSAAAFHFAALGGQPTTIVALANRDRDDVALRIVFAVADLIAGATGNS
jgi:D-alanyl-D-alanine carboxypeptidase